MSGISGLSSAMDWSSASLGVHSTGLQVTAHNVANVSTAGFDPQRAAYATSSSGNGVVLDTVYKETGALAQGLPQDSAVASSVHSGTELSQEFPQMISTQRGFEANAVIVRTSEEMLGTIIDMVA